MENTAITLSTQIARRSGSGGTRKSVYCSKTRLTHAKTALSIFEINTILFIAGWKFSI